MVAPHANSPPPMDAYDNGNAASSGRLVIMAGAGGAVSSFLMTPFDVIKVRQQAVLRKVNPFKQAAEIVRQEGAGALWCGLQKGLMLTVPGTALYLFTYDMLRRELSCVLTDNLSSASPLFAGGAARALSVIATAPIELLRTREQGAQNDPLLAYIRAVAQSGGARALWHGAHATLARDVPNAAIYWFAYEKLRTSVMEPQQTATPIATTSGLAAIAGAVSGAATTPIDVLKTRLQLLKPRQAERGLGSVCMNVVRVAGVQGLFTGVVLRASKVALSCATIVSAYELGKDGPYNRIS